MNLGRTTLNKVYFFSLLVFPSIYILLSYFFNSIQPLYSLKSVDPEYAYFMSGLNLSLLKFNLGHIDHPGSPLQYILAICFRCTYLFRTTELPYIEDVLLNSDSYLSIANFVVNSILSLMLVFIGFKCFKITNNIAYSLLLQTTPFITQITYDSLGRITPEPLMLIPISLLALYLFEFFFNKKKPDSTKEIFILGFISGLALSIKLTCIPLWIIPIVIIPGMRKKFIFIGIATLSFLTISIPVLIKIEQFWHWGKNLFLHSGDYGQGEANIVYLAKFMPQIQLIISENWVFFIFLILLMVSTLIFLFFKKYKFKNIFTKTSIALILAISFQLLIVGKHFRYHYFVPALYLYPVILITSFELIKTIGTIDYLKKIISTVIILFLIGSSFFQIKIAQDKIEYLVSENKKNLSIQEEIKKLDKNGSKLIIPGYSGCVAKEYSLYFAYAWAGKHKQFYQPIYARLIPNNYIFLPWDSSLHYWENPNENVIKNEKTPIYLIIENDDEKKRNESIKKLIKQTGSKKKLTPILQYKDSLKNSAIYKLSSK